MLSTKKLQTCNFSWKQIFEKLDGPHQSWINQFIQYNLIKLDQFWYKINYRSYNSTLKWYNMLRSVGGATEIRGDLNSRFALYGSFASSRCQQRPGHKNCYPCIFYPYQNVSEDNRAACPARPGGAGPQSPRPRGPRGRPGLGWAWRLLAGPGTRHMFEYILKIWQCLIWVGDHTARRIGDSKNITKYIKIYTQIYKYIQEIYKIPVGESPARPRGAYFVYFLYIFD